MTSYAVFSDTSVVYWYSEGNTKIWLWWSHKHITIYTCMYSYMHMIYIYILLFEPEKKYMPNIIWCLYHTDPSISIYLIIRYFSSSWYSSTDFPLHWPLVMMTSSNGNIFRVTDHLCGEFTDHRWISRTKASDAELWCFLWINGWVNNRTAGDLWHHRAHYDVTVMWAGHLSIPLH